MQLTKNGIPCNVPQRFHPKAKVQVVKQKQQLTLIEHKHFAELTRYKDGLEQSVIGPVGTKEYNHSIHQGFETVSEWMVGGNEQ